MKSVSFIVQFKFSMNGEFFNYGHNCRHRICYYNSQTHTQTHTHTHAHDGTNGFTNAVDNFTELNVSHIKDNYT